MKRSLKFGIVLLLIMALFVPVAFAQDVVPSPSPTPTPMVEPSPSPSPTPVVLPSPTPTPEPPPLVDDGIGDGWEYLQNHLSIVGGMVIADDQLEKLIEIRIVDDFPVAEKFRGVVRASAFSINRAGLSIPDPKIPLSVQDLKAYSDGEVWAALYRPLNEFFSAECLGGVTFKMISITGTVGNPYDGTKIAGACGFRFNSSNRKVNIFVLGGHYGPVATEQGTFAGFIPNVIIHAYIPLDFLGSHMSFVPDLAFGRNSITGVVTRSIRLGIATDFKRNK